ncbi:hypothetical protein [Sulfuricurvum sp.]|uniref:hypothetical protein n=1 Tax=Sulfuricurvum sp. TaxID=2025608 RepID=UPI002605AFBC|nr:hypothetical protein [Sulfuricurvum sp.]MDD2780470.1 hypothetical protein [Sulfuricurvum sp.]
MNSQHPYMFAIFAPSFDSSSGGCIVLHKLCDILNQLGYQAYLYTFGTKIEKYIVNQKYTTPLIDRSFFHQNIQNFIVVYPEIISGNPLKAPNVVRWLLHKPGFFTHEIDFGENDYILGFSPFSYQNPDFKIHDKLLILEGNLDIFKNYHFSKREGSCYIKRKNPNAIIVHDMENSIEIVDTTPSSALAELFNKKIFFYCYDPYTFLCIQAALCGCIPVIIPCHNMSKEEWRKSIRSYNGISYGFDDIAHATSTQYLVRLEIEEVEQNNKRFVDAFYWKVSKFFMMDRSS